MRRFLILFFLPVAFGPAPAAAQTSDVVDEACRAVTALGCTATYRDADGDGYGDPATERRSPFPDEGRVTVGGDCDDGDPDVHPGAIESYDGRDEDCDGEIDEPTTVVTELMVNPKSVADTAGEYVEVQNTSGEDASLAGVVLSVGSSSCALDGVLAAGGRLVVARNADPAVNGGFTPDVRCSFTLTNSGTTVTLASAVGTLDAVDYTGWTVPDGASLELDRSTWCPATTPLPSGDFGTPGDANDACL